MFSSDKPPSDLAKVKVLITEDEKTLQKFATIYFKRAGILEENITIANNGQEAIDKVKEMHDGENLLIIYMDDQMPKMYGSEATPRIRNHEEENNLPKSFIFTCSATADNQFKEANSRIPKPFQPNDIKAVIQEALEYYQSLQNTSNPGTPKGSPTDR